jgi:hypothetical protein
MSTEIEKLKKKFETEKQTKLAVAICIDLLGYLSYIIPVFAEFADLAIAPISAILVYIFFNKKLKWAGFTFFEEILPFTDVIPSATIAWHDMYVRNQEKTIEDMIESEKRKENAFKKYASNTPKNSLSEK